MRFRLPPNRPRPSLPFPHSARRFPANVAAVFSAILLFALVLALFSPSIRYPLVAFDDLSYVAANRMVLSGLSVASVKEAFCSFYSYAGMYMPLLWISFMADVSFFGASPGNPAPFHAVNVVLHAADAVLFFFLLLRLRALSRRPPASDFRFHPLFPASRGQLPAFCLLLFSFLWAIHPLRVESVAWVSERKDVLSFFFALISALVYLSPVRGAAGLWSRRVFSCGAFAAALLVKPSLIPFPFLLLALDLLVLRRPFSSRLVLSKVPFFALSAAISAATLWGHRNACDSLPFAVRLFHLPQTLAHYLQTILWPRHLTLLAPDPLYAPLPAFLDALLLAAFLFLAWRMRRTAPLVSLGVFWFFLFLLPVSGLAAIPNNAVADRFSYVPAAGISVALLELLPWTKRGRPAHGEGPGTLLPVAGVFPRHVWNGACCLVLCAAVGAEAFLTSRLLPNWRSSDALFARVLRFSPGQPFASLHLVRKAIVDSGDFPLALRISREILERSPDCRQVIVPIASCLDNIDGPLPALEFLAAHRPPSGHFLGEWAWRMAQLSLRLGRPGDALSYAGLADANIPPQDNLHANIDRLRAAASSPALLDALPHYLSQWMAHERADALDFFRHLVAAYPDRPDILANIAWILATASWSPAPPSEALVYASRALALAGDCPPAGLLDTYAAALANASDFPAAAAAQKRAISLLAPDSPSLPAYQARLGLYLQSAPFRQDIGISG